MRKILTINLLIACLVLPACSDHIGTVALDTGGPEAPINDPDSGLFDPTGPGDSGPGDSGSGDTGPGDTGSASNGGGESGVGQNGGSGTSGSQGGSGTGGANIGGEPGGGGGGTPGGGGQPVPEPGSLLLVGSGLAGIGASLLRRRRKRDELES